MLVDLRPFNVTGKNAELLTALQYVQAIADTYKAATSALANNGGWPAAELNRWVVIAAKIVAIKKKCNCIKKY